MGIGASSGSGFLSCSWTSLLPCFARVLASSTISSSALSSTLTARCSSASSESQPAAEPDSLKGIHEAADRIKELFAMCDRAFGGGREPSNEQLKEVQQALDCITAADLSLPFPPPPHSDIAHQRRQQQQFGRRSAWWPLSQPAPVVTYIQVYECEDFSIGIFVLPASACLPLHDHPGMTVLSKLLYGSMHVLAFDWVQLKQGDIPLSPSAFPGTAVKAHAAELVHNRQLDAPVAPLILRPNSGGNVHEFTAVTACAMLDVLAPPYDPYGGRSCTYYQKHEGESIPETSWLVPTRQPRWLQMREDSYRGPKPM